MGNFLVFILYISAIASVILALTAAEVLSPSARLHEVERAALSIRLTLGLSGAITFLFMGYVVASLSRIVAALENAGSERTAGFDIPRAGGRDSKNVMQTTGRASRVSEVKYADGYYAVGARKFNSRVDAERYAESLNYLEGN